MKTGLVSITFRQLTPEQIVELVAAAGLDGIEWGGDVHVPHGDLDTARKVADLTRNTGLDVAAYGSYYRAGEPEGVNANPAFLDVLATAQALGAPSIRVWAGKRGSAEADAEYRAQVVGDLERIDSLGVAKNIAIALEFHGGTLTDTTESTRMLMDDLANTNVKFYWQPQLGVLPEHAETQIRMLAPKLANLHVFAWEKLENGIDRRPLQEHAADWEKYLNLSRQVAGDERWALLEFVKNDDPEQLKADAAALNGIANIMES